MEQSTSTPNQSFSIKAQYIKDLSFENPNAPKSLLMSNLKPAIDVSVDLKVQKMQESLYEMTLHIASRATHEGNNLFLVDLAYAGIFQISGIAPDRLEPVLLVDCPFVLFPFARRVIADITRDGGFPPLLLDPIDFHSLYLQNLAKKQPAGATS